MTGDWKVLTDGQLMGVLAEIEDDDLTPVYMAHLVVERHHPLVAAEIDRFLR
jgi:hypothetical protein